MYLLNLPFAKVTLLHLPSFHSIAVGHYRTLYETSLEGTIDGVSFRKDLCIAGS